MVERVGGNNDAVRTWPRRDLEKTRDMCGLSVIVRLGLITMCGHRLCFSVLGNEKILMQSVVMDSTHLHTLGCLLKKQIQRSKLWRCKRLFGELLKKKAHKVKKKPTHKCNKITKKKQT